MPRRAQRGRHLRCLDARQDRGRRPGRRRVHEPHLHQRLDQARAGPLPLRAHAEAKTASSSTTASSAAWRTTASTSRRRPAARRGCSRMMEDYLQTEWPDLEVWLTSITEQWAVIAVQGPKARDVLAPLVEGIDLSRDAFPHMAVREGRISGVPSRLFRVSFTGELGFEINVPADHGRAVWEALWRGRALRHHALRHRDHARAARRERLHHRRAGDRRHGDAGRSRPCRADRQDEDRLRRQALPRAAGSSSRPTASSSSASSRRTRGSCSTRARRSFRSAGPAAADAHARPRHVEL